MWRTSLVCARARTAVGRMREMNTGLSGDCLVTWVDSDGVEGLQQWVIGLDGEKAQISWEEAGSDSQGSGSRGKSAA